MFDCSKTLQKYLFVDAYLSMLSHRKRPQPKACSLPSCHIKALRSSRSSSMQKRLVGLGLCIWTDDYIFPGVSKDLGSHDDLFWDSHPSSFSLLLGAVDCASI
jgi:hypothetical protein